MDNQNTVDNTITGADVTVENVPKTATRAQKKQSLDGIQLAGLIMMLVAFIGGAVVTHLSGAENFATNIISLVAMAACICLAMLGMMTLSIVAACIYTLSLLAIKIVAMISEDAKIAPALYAWIPIMAIAIVGAALFIKGIQRLKLEKNVLATQVQELIMIDPLTGLYNLRSLFMDIQTQISFAERNKVPISMMIVKLRYPAELKRVLKKNEFNTAIKDLAGVICDTVRLEDRVYSIDPDGVFAVILTCDKAGAKIVKSRLTANLEKPEKFENVTDKPIRVEVKVGYTQYVKEKFNRDAESFKKAAEDEADYDI